MDKICTHYYYLATLRQRWRQGLETVQLSFIHMEKQILKKEGGAEEYDVGMSMATRKDKEKNKQKTEMD